MIDVAVIIGKGCRLKSGATSGRAHMIFLAGRIKGRSLGLIRNGLKAAATATSTMIVSGVDEIGVGLKCHVLLPFCCCC